MFDPNFNKVVRYRYKCDHDNKRYSRIHSKNSPLVLKSLKPYRDFQITIKLINYDNDDEFLFGLLRISKGNQFQMINGLVTGQITSDEIKLDFLSIEIIKSKELSGSQSIDRNEPKRRENCRLLVCIKCPSKEEQIKSQILRNKNVGIVDIDVCPIAGPFANTSPNIFIVHLKKMVPYYPDEVTMVAGDYEFKSISLIKDAMKENLYQSYKFDIPDRFLINSHSCKLQCKMFGITSNAFALSLMHFNDQSDEVNLPINSENYPSFAKRQAERSVTSATNGLTISDPRTRKDLEQAIIQRKNKLSGETYGDLSKKFENQPTMSRGEPKNTIFAQEDNSCETIIPISENYSISSENTTIGTRNETDINFSAIFSETVQISNLSFDKGKLKNTEFEQEDNSGETIISIAENYSISSGEPPSKKVTYEDYYNTPFTPVSENCSTPIPLLDPKSEDAKYLIDNFLPSDYQSYYLSSP